MEEYKLYENVKKNVKNKSKIELFEDSKKDLPGNYQEKFLVEFQNVFLKKKKKNPRKISRRNVRKNTVGILKKPLGNWRNARRNFRKKIQKELPEKIGGTI